MKHRSVCTPTNQLELIFQQCNFFPVQGNGSRCMGTSSNAKTISSPLFRTLHPSRCASPPLDNLGSGWDVRNYNEKLGDRTMQQYKEYIQRERPNEDWPEYIDYKALVINISSDLKSYSYLSKKKAIFEYCTTNSSASCESINSMKADLDYFHSARKEILNLP